MKKILFLFTLLSSFLYTSAQTSVIISGDARPQPDRKYTYNMVSAPHGISRTKAKWTIENGEFAGENGGKTTLEQDVDFTSVDVIWTKVNSPGTLKYSYANGSTSYAGQINVSIEPAATSSGTKIEISGPKKLYSGQEATYNFRGLPTSSDVDWGYLHYLQYVKNKEHDGRSITVKATPASGIINASLWASSTDQNGDYKRATNIKIIGDPKIVPVADISVCPGNTYSFSIQEFQEYPGLTVQWSSGQGMTLLPGQGVGPTATFTASGYGYATVKAVAVYKGITYNLQCSDGWVGMPSTPSILEFRSTPPEFAPNANYTFNAVSNGVGLDTTSEFIWTVQGAATIIQKSASSVTVQTKGSKLSSTFSITVATRNKCGTTATFTGYGTVRGTGGGVEPPITEKSALAPIDQPEIKSVKIYNLSGVLVYSNDAVNGTFDIKSTVLTNGVYIIEKFDGENKTSEKVMLKR